MNTKVWLLAPALALAVAACDVDSLLDVPDPDVVSVPVVQDPENLSAVKAGAIREFARAVGGVQNNEGGQILYSGLFADEYYHSGSFTTRQEVDARDIAETNAGNGTAFFWLQRARNHAALAAQMFAESDEAGSADHADVLGLEGFTYVLFGENYCSGVPFSTLPIAGETEYGEPLSRTEMFNRAIDQFDAALGMVSSGTEADMARIGKARALLNLGQYGQAAALVSSIPTSFGRDVAYSESVQAAWNAVWNLVNAEKRWSAAASEGTNGLPFGTDARTTIAFTGPGFRATVDHYEQLRYDTQGDDVPLATGTEARLIEAEDALNNGPRADFFSIHNGLRTAAGLPTLTDTGQTFDELVDLHFEERAYWLWQTSHRLGDLRRLVLQYDRSPADVYPVGATVQGETRGNQLTLRVPFDERTNPSYDASACDPTQPG
ncbi:MAG: hypothetical protein R6U63_07060 [Longimicrobiales bacterium]